MNKMQLKQYLSSVLPNTTIFNNIFDPFPMCVHFAMTNRCNLSCTFCGQAKDKWRKEDELTFEQYKDLIDQVAAMNNRTVSFSGGEIFLYRDIDKILEHCHHRQITIDQVLTNGTLLNEHRIKALIEYNVKFVGFSIDGVRDSHDGIRGLKGTYDKTISAIKMLNELKKKRENTDPSIGINFVVTKNSVSEMEAVAKIASELNVNMLRFSHLNYISEKKLKEHRNCLKTKYPDFNFCYWDGFVDNDTALDSQELMREIKRIEKQYRHISFSHNLSERNMDKWYNSDEPIFNRCAFLGSCFFVLPNGDFPLCDFVRYPVGNVKERSLLNLWFDDKASAFRNSISKKLLPGCERCCSVS
jgi:MoaA/NifB/PqqE/SkfB family radical SAM enzyme